MVPPGEQRIRADRAPGGPVRFTILTLNRLQHILIPKTCQ
jgi:hypothetical protein